MVSITTLTTPCPSHAPRFRPHRSRHLDSYSLQHLTHLAKVLDALAEAGFTISEAKSHFGYSYINILRHKVSRLRLSIQDEKIKAIRDLSFPETLADAWTIFGTLNYHRAFVKNFSKIATPLTDTLCHCRGKETVKNVIVEENQSCSSKEIIPMHS